MTLDHLVLARQHVTGGEKHIARQRGMISQLERGGHDAAEAELLLNSSNCTLNK
jgi:hypothetical protein